MNSKTNNVGDRKVRPTAHIIAVALCLLLMLMSFALVNATSLNASAHHANKQTYSIPATDTSTPSPTDTSTPSPTITPTPSPTTPPTPTKTPTPKPTPKPTSTPTSAPGVTPTATTSQPTPTTQPGTTPTSSDNSQTPTAISGVPNTNTNNGNNGGNNNIPTPPSDGGFSLSPSTVSIGLLTLFGFGGALFVGLLLLRKRFLPRPVPQASLPPSGAQPWRRVRSGSLNGITNTRIDWNSVQNDWNNWPANIARSSGTPVQGSTPPMAPNTGYNTTNNSTFASPYPASFPGGVTPPFSPSPNPAVYPNTTMFSSPNNGVSPNYNNAFPPVPSSPNPRALPNNAISPSLPTSPNISAPPSYNNAFPATSGGPIPVPNIANAQGRPFQAPSNNNSVSPISIAEQPPSTADVLPRQATQTPSGLYSRRINTNTDPLAEQVRPPVRQATRPIRLQNISNAAPPATQNPAPQNHMNDPFYPISEELPSFNDPFLRDTLK